MPAISGITRPDPVEFTATLGGESVTVVFDGAKLTSRWAQAVRNAEAAEDLDVIVGKLSEILISWDVTDEQGAEVPPSKDVLLDLPAKALGALTQRLQEAALPSDAEGNASSPSVSVQPSGSEETSESFPNGSDTSSLPAPSTVPS